MSAPPVKDKYFWIAMALGPSVWLGLLTLFSRTVNQRIDIQLMLIICLLYPVLEELSFRGLVQTWLLDRTSMNRQLITGVTVANVVTSILFALAHLISHSPLWAALVFFPSLVFGFFRERHDSVVTPILLHGWYNTGFFLLFV